VSRSHCRQTRDSILADPSVPAFIEMVDVALRSYFLTPASYLILSSPVEVHEAVRGVKVSKSPGTNGMLKMALKHHCYRAVSLLANIFNVVLRTYHFRTVWNHARLICILEPGKDPALSSSYRPISLLDPTVKLFENILLVRILYEVSERGLMRDEHLGLTPRQARPCSWPV